MTTQVFPFLPPPQGSAAFEFNPTLDGSVYSAIVTWNLFGQRWYLSVYDLSRSLIFSLPMVGSPTGFSILSMTWQNGQVLVTTNTPHRYRPTLTFDLTISGATPVAYNGVHRAFILSGNQFQFPLARNPGPVTQLGNVDYNVDIAGGYFTDVLLFRQDAQRFEAISQ